jgi:glycosyltransferase involved in cell wall biosynthesis
VVIGCNKQKENAMSKPLVSVICVCYNQKPYVRSTIQSVLDQRYANVEFIIIEVATTDGSKELIDQLIAAHPGIKFFPQKKMIGYSKAFNLALKHAKGEFIINLNAGNMLHVNRIEEGVSGFQDRDNSFGINYTDAEYIDEHGTAAGNFYSGKKFKSKPEEYVFKDLLRNDFICSPTLMFRKKVLDEFKGYDEYLLNKNFTFLLQGSKTYKFFYIDQALVKVRVPAGSVAGQQIKDASQHRSTYEVLLNAQSLLENKQEKKAWKKRIKYECIQALKTMDWRLAMDYINLYFKKGLKKSKYTTSLK